MVAHPARPDRENLASPVRETLDSTALSNSLHSTWHQDSQAGKLSYLTQKDGSHDYATASALGPLLRPGPLSAA
jgi:hypothetical protein